MNVLVRWKSPLLRFSGAILASRQTSPHKIAPLDVAIGEREYDFEPRPVIRQTTIPSWKNPKFLFMTRRGRSILDLTCDSVGFMKEIASLTDLNRTSRLLIASLALEAASGSPLRDPSRRYRPTPLSAPMKRTCD